MFNKRYEMLHVFNDPKFSKGFFAFLLKHTVDLSKHFLFHYRCTPSSCEDYGMDRIFAAHFFSPLANLLMLKPLFQADKIIIHSLASPFLLIYLYLFPSLVKKSYWVIWGKDLYFHNTLNKKRPDHLLYEFFRRRVIRNIPHIITHIDGEYERAKQWYGSTARHHKCFMYPSNLYTERPFKEKSQGRVKVLLGNSADPSNNHLEVFELLAKFKDTEIEIIVPLSYGNKRYANRVIEAGQRIFGDKFTPLTELIPLPKYLDMLEQIDIAIFAHRRQQAMGNITSLLGMGKKVYLRNDISSWEFFAALGVETFNLDTLDIKPLDHAVQLNNKEKIRTYFSEAQLVNDWQKIVDDIPG